MLSPQKSYIPLIVRSVLVISITPYIFVNNNINWTHLICSKHSSNWAFCRYYIFAHLMLTRILWDVYYSSPPFYRSWERVANYHIDKHVILRFTAFNPALGHQNQCVQHQWRDQRQIDNWGRGGGSKWYKRSRCGHELSWGGWDFQVIKTAEVPGGLQTAISPTFPATGLFCTPTPFIVHSSSECSDERVKKSELLENWRTAGRKNL